MGASDVVLLKLKQAGIRPKDLAVALNVTRPMASLMLSGKRGIPTWHLEAIARLLKTEVFELFAPTDLVWHSPRVDSDLSGGKQGGSSATASVRPDTTVARQAAQQAAAIIYAEGVRLQRRSAAILRRLTSSAGARASAEHRVRDRVRKAPRKRTRPSR